MIGTWNAPVAVKPSCRAGARIRMKPPPKPAPQFEFSVIGRKLTARSGILELMDDLGRAMTTEPHMRMLGGGNPSGRARDAGPAAPADARVAGQRRRKGIDTCPAGEPDRADDLHLRVRKLQFSNGTTGNEVYTSAITIAGTTIIGDANNTRVVYQTVPEDAFYKLGDRYIVHRVYAVINAGVMPPLPLCLIDIHNDPEDCFAWGVDLVAPWTGPTSRSTLIMATMHVEISIMLAACRQHPGRLLGGVDADPRKHECHRHPLRRMAPQVGRLA